ncbi:MAG TPA: hypothetical protein VFS21_00560 [Roseiflexaceae bacterium]|nr:hypothetical protein [Roseiflexaceae bacterium]
MNRALPRARLLAVAALVLLAAAIAVYVLVLRPQVASQPQLPAELDGTAPEYPITRLPLAGEITDADAQISGLAWYNDYLIILPQYPGWSGSAGDGKLYAIPKQQLLDLLDGASAGPITPREIALAAPGLEAAIGGFQGFEAIGFSGDRVFLTVEAEDSGMKGFLVAGAIAPDLSRIAIDTGTVVALEPPAQIENASFEALVVLEDAVGVLYEANGRNVNPQPRLRLFDLSLQPKGDLAFPSVEYRLTDATPVDASGSFWVVNYFFPDGQNKYNPAEDLLRSTYGTGPTHAQTAIVERLVELRLTDAGAALASTAPVQLQLAGDNDARNWEGIARLDDRGFLLMTDTFPETILAFVPKT